MKAINSIIFLILIFVIIFVIFNFSKNKFFFKLNNIGQNIDCYSDKIDVSVLSLPSKLKYIDAFISFDNIILDDTINNSLKELNIELDEGSIVFDHIWSKIPVSSLCNLIQLTQVKYVFTLNNK